MTENSSIISKIKFASFGKINLENNNIIEEFRSLCNRYKNNIKDVIVQLNEIDKSIDEIDKLVKFLRIDKKKIFYPIKNFIKKIKKTLVNPENNEPINKDSDEYKAIEDELRKIIAKYKYLILRQLDMNKYYYVTQSMGGGDMIVEEETLSEALKNTIKMKEDDKNYKNLIDILDKEKGLNKGESIKLIIKNALSSFIFKDIEILKSDKIKTIDIKIDLGL